jgi:NAD(P)-dependent dehydrogenase (short-subunit alcohol dehydrogenase family)
VTSLARTALITGGEGDLALAVRERLLEEGWQVHAPGKAELDVTQTGSVTAYFATLTRLDLLINNAGIIDDTAFLAMKPEQWDRVQAVNLDGAFRCARAALKFMVKQRSGHILNVGSYAALHPVEGQANYAASKAALIGLTQSIALEYGARSIRCNGVLPGFLETKMTRDTLARYRDRILAAHSLGALNTVADAARFIVTLDSFPQVSGQIFQLDSRVRRWA